MRVYVLCLANYDDVSVEGVYASKQAAEDAEVRWNRKNPFSPYNPLVYGPFTLRGVKRNG